MSFDALNPQENLVTDLSRSLNEILDSLNTLASSLGEVVTTVDTALNASGIRDELFTREIRQTQLNLVEFRQKMEKLSGEHTQFSSDHQQFLDRIEKLLPNTLEILNKLDQLSRDVLKYVMELSEKSWEKYQTAGEGITKSLGELKHIYQEILNRSNEANSKPNAILVEYLQRIDSLIKSCDQSLHLIKSSLPQDLEESLNLHSEKSDLSFRSLDSKVEVLLQAYYKDHFKDEKGDPLDLISVIRVWLSNSIFSLFSKYLFYILMFLLGGWFFKGQSINPFEHITTPPAQVQVSDKK